MILAVVEMRYRLGDWWIKMQINLVAYYGMGRNNDSSGRSLIFSRQTRAYDDVEMQEMQGEKFCIGKGEGEHEEDVSFTIL